MADQSFYKAKFKELRCCVLIPTYNNERTVGKVINEVLQYTDDLLVVNDGSTDSTSEILKSINSIQLLSFDKNKGKGIALREGFKLAIAKGYEYAITLDSDGQHYPKDIPALLNKLDDEKNILIIGARNMDQASVPGKSSFGNKFSSFWYWVITGIKLPDTQSGFRLYPVGKYKNMNFYTGKFEFEIEVMVRSAWAGIKVLPIPVEVYYGQDRVSHFRPGPDVFRITLLNTLFVLLSFFYIRPRNFILNLGKKKFWEEVKNSIIGAQESNMLKSLSVAYGIFIGIFPIWGFQLLIGIPVAVALRLNVAIVVASANISIPPMNILIMYLSYLVGQAISSDDQKTIVFNWSLTHQDFLSALQQFMIGGMILAIAAAIIAWIISYGLLSVFRKNPMPIQEKATPQ